MEDAMPTADEHLRKALEEYNAKVSALEDGGDRTELLDAYINRGTVLSLMDSYVAAIEDFDDAIDLMREMEAGGVKVDPGCWVRAYVSRGELQGEKGDVAMANDYAEAAKRIKLLGPKSKHFIEREIPEVCADCASDLVDASMPEDALPFTQRALRALVGKEDDASRNLYVRVCNLDAEAQGGSGEAAEESYREAARVGDALFAEDRLKDMGELALAHASLEEILEDRGAKSESVEEGEKAIEVLEKMLQEGSLDDQEILSAMHGRVAKTLMDDGKVKEAEKHLMRQVALSIGGAKDYMDGAGEGGWRYDERFRTLRRRFL